MKILHVIGGSPNNGAFKGAYILHKTLVKLGIDSLVLNDTPYKTKLIYSEKHINNLKFVNNDIFKKLINKFFIITEKILKSIFLHSPRSTFTIGILGFDITNLEEYKTADIVHIHWLNQGFISLRSLSKIKKPVVWTLRDMWSFSGGSHYLMDFEKFEKGFLSKKLKEYKKKKYNKNFQFIAISDWLNNEAKKSFVLGNRDIKTIYNNIDLNDFKIIDKNVARDNLKISTKKKIILYGANNPQTKRKGWNIFVESLRKLDKSKYMILIFGSFWSHKVLEDIGIEYFSFGFVNDNKKLNNIYASADYFIASSIQEAFGKTWAECLACGTPVVCFANTAISEIIKHKESGYIIEDFNSALLKDSIEWMAVNSHTLKNKNDLRKTVEEFDSNKIAKKYVEIYRQLIN